MRPLFAVLISGAFLFLVALVIAAAAYPRITVVAVIAVTVAVIASGFRKDQ